MSFMEKAVNTRKPKQHIRPCPEESYPSVADYALFSDFREPASRNQSVLVVNCNGSTAPNLVRWGCGGLLLLRQSGSEQRAVTMTMIAHLIAPVDTGAPPIRWH